MKQLVIGWGNPLAGDDGIGPRASEILAGRIGGDVHVLSTSYAGLRLVETMRGYDRVIIADVRIDEADTAMDTAVIRPHELAPLGHSIRHDSSLSDALHVFRAMQDPQLPEEIILITVPISAPREWENSLSPTGERAAKLLADAVVRELEVPAVV